MEAGISGTDIRSIWRLINRSRGLRVLIAGYIGLSILFVLLEGVGLSLLIPLFSDPQVFRFSTGIAPLDGLLSWVNGQPPQRKFQFIALVFVALLALRCALEYAAGLLSAIIPRRMQEANLRVFCRDLSEMDILAFEREGFDNWLGVLTHHVKRCADIVMSMLSGVTSLLLLLFYGAALVLLAWQAALAAAVLAAVTLSLTLRLGRVQRELGILLNRSSVRWQGAIYSLLHNLRLVRTSPAFETASVGYRRCLADYIRNTVDMTRVSLLVTPINTAGAGLGLALCLYVTAARADLAAGEMVALTAVLYRLIGPAAALGALRVAIHGGLPALREFTRLGDLAARHRMIDGSASVPLPLPDIRVEDVRFDYGRSGLPALRGVSLAILPHGVTAVVGPSGAGKSTLLAVLCRLIEPPAGRVLVGERDVRDFRRRDWGLAIGVVSQDISMVYGSVAENIALGAERLDQAAVEAAAKAAQAHDFIMAMPQGYDSRVGTTADPLSGGQRQRIALARALFRRPPLLILDEPTSKLDPLTGNELLQLFALWRQTGTVLVVSHTGHTIRTADHIVYVDEGRVVEQGSLKSLLAANGPFRAMWAHEIQGRTGNGDNP